MKKSVKNEEKKNMFSIFSNNSIARNAKKILMAGTLICGLTLIPSNAMAGEAQRGGEKRVRVENRNNKPGNREMKVNNANNRAPQIANAKPAPRPQAAPAPTPRPVVVHTPAPPVQVVHKPAPRPIVVHTPAPPVHVVHKPAPRPVVVHTPAPPVHVVHEPVHHHCNNDITNAAAVVIGVASLISLLAN